MNLTRGINLRKVAEGMPGSSGAEVKGVCTEAGMYALRERRVHVTQEDFEMAVAKVRGRGSTARAACNSMHPTDHDERFRKEHVNQKAVEINL